jgi:transposase-like protein
MGKVLSDRAKFWQQHVEATKSFPGSIQKYCEQHELDPSSLYQWRKRFSGATQVKTKSEFLPVVVSSPARAELPAMSPLPNAQWVAEVMLHLIRGLA